MFKKLKNSLETF